MQNSISEILIWFFLSAVKYLFAVTPLIAKSSREWYWDMLIVSAGGCTGVVVFTYLGEIISNYLSKFHFFKIKNSKLRKFIKIKNSYGLIGIAVLSPIVFSIPLGCIISASFEHDKNKIIRYQIISVLIWSIVLFGLKGIFGYKVDTSI